VTVDPQAREKARLENIRLAAMYAEIEAENKKVRDVRQQEWRQEKGDLQDKIQIIKAEVSNPSRFGWRPG
jgi:hypothetical protein